MPASSRPSARRQLDRESGMNRTRPQKGKSRAPPQEDLDEGEFLSSDTELESELEMPAKDDSRRRKPPPPSAARRNFEDGRTKFIKGEEDVAEDMDKKKESDSGQKVAPHMVLLSASTYHVGISSISYPASSSFIPYAGNLFSMVYWICSSITDNTILHEMCPEFFSPVIFLYYGHAVYYHILRARSAAGSDVLTRLEKRALTFYERVAPPESWPIAAPLLGFFHYLGSHKVDNPMYGWIVPRLPVFSALTANIALGALNLLSGGQRLPLIPALQKLVYNFANDIADFDEGIIRPVGQDDADATHTFVGINNSGAASAPFQALAFNSCWPLPLETGEDIGVFDYAIKRARLRRWNVPDVPDNSDCSTLTGFLGFQDGQSFDWMKHLLQNASIVNRFFPGSGTLSDVPPLTTLGMATQMKYKRFQDATAQTDVWFHSREGYSFSFYGYSNTETGLSDTKMALTVSVNAEFSSTAGSRVVPQTGRSIDPVRQGPFFIDGQNPAIERKEQVVTEGANQIDPARRFLELISPMYDNRAGRN
ncbi:coat protein [Clohesyomyces aquaticus partitivirus 1]|nr:coat protein [Clohesyomyces aquaticus partitivirus 1]